MPLLKLLDSKNGSLQHNAAFALYGLADNEVCYHVMVVNLAKCLDLVFGVMQHCVNIFFSPIG